MTEEDYAALFDSYKLLGADLNAALEEVEASKYVISEIRKECLKLRTANIKLQAVVKAVKAWDYNNGPWTDVVAAIAAVEGE